MSDHYSLKGKVALITGATRGIGFGIAQAYINVGAKVVITGRTEKSLAEAKEKLGDHCYAYVNNVTEKDQHAAFIEKVEREIGAVDVLVNNAGQHGKKPSLECTNTEFAEILDTNLHSIFSLIKAVLIGMIDRKHGSIINISSMSALFGLPQVAAYSSSKTALLGLTRSLTAEYSGHGIRFNCIAPGFIESKMFREIMKADPARELKILNRTPMKRVGLPEEIGHAAVFLASDASAFITGTCLPVDGGASIGF